MLSRDQQQPVHCLLVVGDKTNNGFNYEDENPFFLKLVFMVSTNVHCFRMVRSAIR